MPFDPSKPYEVLESSGFDPSKPFELLPDSAPEPKPAQEPVGTFRSVIGSLARGASQNISGTLKAISEGSAALGRLSGLGEGDPEKLDTFRAGKAIQQKTEELFPVNPEAEKGFWTGDVPQGIGQVASMVTGAGIVKGALHKGLTSLGVKGAKDIATKAAVRSALASGAGAEYDDAYQRAIDRGDDPDLAATKAAGYAALSTAIESKLGVGRVLKRFGINEATTLKSIEKAATGSIAKTGLKEAIAGFSEEALQRVGQDFIVDGNLDWNAITREGGAGAVIQALLGVAGHAVHRKSARSSLEWINAKQKTGITPEDAAASGLNEATLNELKIPVITAAKGERQVDLSTVKEETDPATLQRIAEVARKESDENTPGTTIQTIAAGIVPPAVGPSSDSKPAKVDASGSVSGANVDASGIRTDSVAPEDLITQLETIAAKIASPEGKPTPDEIKLIGELSTSEPEIHQAFLRRVKELRGELDSSKSHKLASSGSIPLPGPTSNKNLPDWAREQMVEQGLDPARTFNDVDIQNPSVREAIEIDPTLTAEQKQRILKTGSIRDTNAKQVRQEVIAEERPKAVEAVGKLPSPATTLESIFTEFSKKIEPRIVQFREQLKQVDPDSSVDIVYRNGGMSAEDNAYWTVRPEANPRPYWLVHLKEESYVIRKPIGKGLVINDDPVLPQTPIRVSTSGDRIEPIKAVEKVKKLPEPPVVKDLLTTETPTPKVKQPRARTAAQEFDDLVAEYGEQSDWGSDLESSEQRKLAAKGPQSGASVTGRIASGKNAGIAARKALGDLGAKGGDLFPTAANKGKFLPKLKEYLARKAEESNAPDTVDTVPDYVATADDPFADNDLIAKTVEYVNTEGEGKYFPAVRTKDGKVITTGDRHYDVDPDIYGDRGQRGYADKDGNFYTLLEVARREFKSQQSLPKLRSGENQGDVFANQTEDFALVGEQGKDLAKAAEAKAKAERDAAEAKAIQDKQQQTFFSKSEGWRIEQDPSADHRRLVLSSSGNQLGVVGLTPKGVWRVFGDQSNKRFNTPEEAASQLVSDLFPDLRSIGSVVSNPISQQAATQAVNERLGTSVMPSNIRFVNDSSPESDKGSVTYVKGQLPQITINLAKHDSPESIKDTLVHELVHPSQADPAMARAVRAVAALVQETDLSRKEALGYSAEETPIEATNELIRKFYQEHANSNIFSRAVTQVVIAAKRIFGIELTARQAAVILVQDAVKNHVAASSGEGLSKWGENKRAETLRNSIRDTAERRVLGREEREGGVEYALQQFADVGLKVYRGNADLLFIDPQERFFDNQPALERLLERVKQTIARSRELPDYGNVFVQSVREMMAGQAAQEKRGEAVMFTNRDTFVQLQQLSRAYFSELGQRLGMMAKNSNGQDVFDILEGPVDLVDRIVFEVDQGYFGGQGGPVVQTIIDEIKNQAGSEVATDESVADAIESILVKVTPPDPGSIVYKLAQGRLKPKQKAKLAQQLSNARVQEAVQSIIELAKANGIKEPPSKTIPLTPSQKLFEMVKPTTVEKIDAAVQEAVRQAERNAGRAAFETDTGGNVDEMALYDAETSKEGDGGGVSPTPEQVERGMNTAEFSHWRVIRDNLLGYSPVTDRMIRSVIRSEFKGTDFSDPTKPQPVDKRSIDLNELARSPEAEVNRVFQAYLDTVSDGMDMQKASPVTKQRILATINAEIVNQLALARTRVNDPFFAPPREPHAKPSKEQAIREALNAGIFSDPRINLPDMVTRVASKGAIKRLLPNIPELIKTVLDTPVKDQKELGQIFADELSRKLDVSQEQATRAAEVFSQAYRTKFNAARETALKAASEALSPEQKTILFGNNKQLWTKIEDFVRAGGMDSNEFFKSFAKSKNWKVPSDADIDKLRALIDETNELQRLTPQEVTKAGGDKAKLDAARKERLRVLDTELMLRRRKIEAMVKEWGAPTARNPTEWFTDPVLRRNWNAARNELNSANVLLGPAKFVRQLLDTFTFQMWYIPHRAIANTWNGFKNQLLNSQEPDRIELFHNMSSDLGKVLKVRIETIAHSLRAFQQGLRGRGLPTHIEQLQSGMMMAERLNMRAEELMKKGDPVSKVRSWLTRLWALQTLGHRQFGAIDLLQAKSSEWQEMMSQVLSGLRQKGTMSAELQSERVNDIFGNIAADLISAKNDAEAILSEGGKTPTDGEINLAAWELLQTRLYARVNALELPADDFEAKNKAYTATIAWNRAPEGPGAFLIANPLKSIQKGVEPFFPLPTAMFGNAMGTSLNRALTWVGFGLFPNMFKNHQTGDVDPWYESDVDKLHRRTEAITGITLQAILGSMVLLGLIVVRLGWPKDKKEREEWQVKGISPYTIEFPLGNGTNLKIPLRIGPLAPMAGGLAAASAVRGLMDKKIKEQAKLNEEAAKLGVEPGKATPIGAADLLGVAGTAAWNMMAGGRTASGMLGTYSDFGNLNVGRIISGFTSPMVPLLPAYQEITRLSGIQIDPNAGSFWDMLVPVPWSQARRVNMLGDDVSNPGAVARVIGITTLGGGLTSGLPAENTAYANLYGTGARPQSISRTKGYDFNGRVRPMTRDELAQYARLRGTNLKQELTSLGPVDGMRPEDAKAAVQAAIKTADQRALASLGVTQRSTSTSTRSRSFGRRTRSFRPSKSRSYRIKRFKSPRLTGSRSRRRPLTRTKARKRYLV